MLWTQQVKTDRTIHNNKLDVIICDNEKGASLIVDDFVLVLSLLCDTVGSGKWDCTC